MPVINNEVWKTGCAVDIGTRDIHNLTWRWIVSCDPLLLGLDWTTKSQAVARIADRIASQHLWGHMTSSVTWPFDTPYVISYWWSFGTESLNPAVFEIFALSVLGSRVCPFRVTWRHHSRDHSIAHMPFPIGSPLEPNLYLELFPRYSTSNVTQWLTWPWYDL